MYKFSTHWLPPEDNEEQSTFTHTQPYDRLAAISDKADVNYSVGLKHYRSKNYQQAAEHFEKAVKNDEVGELIYRVDLAKTYRELGKLDEAIYFFTEAKKCHVKINKKYEEREDQNIKFDEFKKNVEKIKKDLEAKHQELCRLEISYTKALKEEQLALQQKPVKLKEVEELYQNLIVVLQNKKANESAIADCEFYSLLCIVYKSLGMLYENSTDYNVQVESTKKFNHLLRLHMNKLTAIEKNKSMYTQVRYDREINRIYYEISFCNLELGKFNSKMENFDVGMDHFNECLELAATADYKAMDVLDKVLTFLNSNDVDFLQEENITKLQELLQNILKINPQNPQAIFGLGKIAYLEKEFDLATNYFESIQDTIDEENKAECKLLLIQSLYEVALENRDNLDSDKSLQTFTKIAKLKPDDASIDYEYGRILYRMGMKKYSLAADKLTTLKDEDTEGHIDCSKLQKDGADYFWLASEHIKKAREKNSDLDLSALIKLLDQMGNTFMPSENHKGDLKLAKMFYLECLKLDPHYIEASFAMGKILYLQKDLLGALPYFKAALNSEDIQIEDLAKLQEAMRLLCTHEIAAAYKILISEIKLNPKAEVLETRFARALMSDKIYETILESKSLWSRHSDGKKRLADIINSGKPHIKILEDIKKLANEKLAKYSKLPLFFKQPADLKQLYQRIVANDFGAICQIAKSLENNQHSILTKRKSGSKN